MGIFCTSETIRERILDVEAEEKPDHVCSHIFLHMLSRVCLMEKPRDAEKVSAKGKRGGHRRGERRF